MKTCLTLTFGNFQITLVGLLLPNNSLKILILRNSNVRLKDLFACIYVSNSFYQLSQKMYPLSENCTAKAMQPVYNIFNRSFYCDFNRIFLIISGALSGTSQNSYFSYFPKTMKTDRLTITQILTLTVLVSSDSNA